MAHTKQGTAHGHPPASRAHEPVPGATHEAVVHDPEHDIDARSATIWVVAGTIVLFISLWVMLPIFMRVQQAERVRKIDQVPNTELHDVVEAERAFLNGQNPSKKSIDQVLQQMAGAK